MKSQQDSLMMIQTCCHVRERPTPCELEQIHPQLSNVLEVHSDSSRHTHQDTARRNIGSWLLGRVCHTNGIAPTGSADQQRETIVGPGRDRTKNSTTITEQLGIFTSWILTGTSFLLIPKCPACLAAYVACGTGIGLSIPTAGTLRIGMISVSLAALAFLTRNLIRRQFHKFKHNTRTKAWPNTWPQSELSSSEPGIPTITSR